MNLNNFSNIFENLENNYKDLKFKKKFLKTYSESNTKLLFGFICPGAVKTINYLVDESKNTKNKKNTNKIIKLTNLLFFIEIITIYHEYLYKDFVKRNLYILNNKSCLIAKLISEEINNTLVKYNKKILNKIPDNFFHLRHKAIVCSNDKNIASDRITMLNRYYKQNNKLNNFNKNQKGGYDYTICEGEKNPFTLGCQNCCNKHFSNDKNNNYSMCINHCMNT